MPYNIASALDKRLSESPFQPAIFYPESRDQQGRVTYSHLTYKQLLEDCNRIASGLHAHGIQTDTRVALMVPPSLDFIALAFALMRGGIVPVMIDPGIGLPSLKKCLEKAKPEAFIGIPKAHAARVALGWAKGTNKLNVTVGKRWFWGGVTLDQVRAKGTKDFDCVATEASDTAAIAFTSGSTGLPKGVVYQHQHLLGQVELMRDCYDIQPGEIDLPTFPLFALFNPHLGVTSVIPDMDPTRPGSVDAGKLVEAIENFGVTHMFGSPALLKRLAQYGVENKITLPSLKRILSAGAPVPPETLETLSSFLNPDAQIFTPYGATEALPVSNMGSDEILLETRIAAERGEGTCVGRKIDGNDLAIIKISEEPIEQWDESLRLPPHQIGEITVKGPSVSQEYFENPSATQLAKIPDADGTCWHRMGDLGYLDHEGRLWFCGRKGHRVCLEEETLFTIPCEAVFNTHPKVARSALVPVKNTAHTEAALCVETLEKLSTKEQNFLRSELMERASQHEHTQKIQHFLFHKSFPVDIRHNSKIFREKLAVWADKRVAKGALS